MPTVTFFNLPSYQDPKVKILSESDLSKAFHAAVMTAKELLDDALFLLNGGRNARAAVIAILALEEAGKIKVLDRIFKAPDESARRDAWREYRDHKAKSAKTVTGGGLGLSEAEVQSNFSRQADALKQLGLYSNLLTSGEWSEPSRTITPNDARVAIEMASYMVEQIVRKWKQTLRCTTSCVDS